MARRKAVQEAVYRWATRAELLAACVVDGAVRVSPIQGEPRPTFTLYRPAASFPGAWGLCVAFRNVSGQWERGSWILDYQTPVGEIPRESVLLSDVHFGEG